MKENMRMLMYVYFAVSLAVYILFVWRRIVDLARLLPGAKSTLKRVFPDLTMLIPEHQLLDR